MPGCGQVDEGNDGVVQHGERRRLWPYPRKAGGRKVSWERDARQGTLSKVSNIKLKS